MTAKFNKCIFEYMVDSSGKTFVDCRPFSLLVCAPLHTIHCIFSLSYKMINFAHLGGQLCFHAAFILTFNISNDRQIPLIHFSCPALRSRNLSERSAP